jgi:hypothetical protein
LLPRLESERQAAIDSASKQLQEAIARLDPELPQRESLHQQNFVASRQALDEYSADRDSIYERWKERQLHQINWHPMSVVAFHSTAGKTFTLPPDRSVLITGQQRAADEYVVEGHLDLTGISALRLEALTDESLPSKGPGLADNGNFVLNEFQVEIASQDSPEDWHPIKLTQARANFEQEGFQVALAIDGKIEPPAGWAMSPKNGQTNWAVFVAETPFGYSGGTRIRVKMHQRFDDRHQIGRFRLAATRFSGSIGTSLPEELTTALARPADSLGDELKQRLVELSLRDDARLKELQDALAAASTPLVVDAEITRLRELLERVSRPIPEDPPLLQLARDLQQSTMQLDAKRLTAAQDLAWALINSPSFLFNR